MRLRSILRSNRLPHILATFQWAILILTLVFNVNFTVFVTGAVAASGLKVIMLFSLWILLFSGMLCAFFYRIRREGVEEKTILVLSVFTAFFSGANIFFHFIDEFVLIMQVTEVIAWGFYNGIFFVSMYKIFSVFVLPALSKDEEMKRGEPRNERKLWT